VGKVTKRHLRNACHHRPLASTTPKKGKKKKKNEKERKQTNQRTENQQEKQTAELTEKDKH